MEKKPIFSGTATALITPMRNGAIDYRALKKIIEYQISGGISALVIGGTTGEAATLTDVERLELYTYVKKAVAGRAKLIFGTGTNDTALAVKHTIMASRIGCDGALVVTPYYNKGTYSGVCEHYKRIAASSELPIILYNVPTRTGVNLTIYQLEELARVENIVAIKEASDSVDRLTELAKFGKELYLYAGNDSQIFATLALGGKGVISVVSNAFPRRVEKIFTDFQDRKYEEALAGQLELLDFTKVMFKETNPSPIKYAMSLLGLSSPEVRMPLQVPEKATKKAIRKAISELENLTRVQNT